MKRLFGFLLVLSIALFAYIQWGGELTGGGRNSQMLAELNPDKIKLLDMSPPAPMAASAVLVAQPAVAASAPAAAVAIAADLPTASAPAAVSAPLAAPDLQKITAAVPAVMAKPLPASAPLHKPAVASEVPVKAAAKSCLEWGEFSGTDLARATKALAALNLGDRLVQRTAEYASGYWVYMPPLKTKAAVNKKIAQLKDLGVEDYYVVQEPKGTHMISLGVFKTQEAAKNYLESLQKKGVRTAKVGERKRMLKFTVFEIKQADTDTAAHLTALQKDFRDSELKTVACKN